MADWQFEYSIHTKADRATVWRYWTNMENLARLEPGVRRIELDGPFASGTTGRTVQDDYTQEWELADVIEGKRFTIMGYTRDASGWLSFSWTF